MSQKANYFRLGIFIIAASAILVAIILALGAGTAFKRTVTIETYFDESVQGLDVGSAVKYRGVQIGRVTRIGFTGSTYQDDLPMKNRRQYVLVEAELQPELIGARTRRGARCMEMIAAGLRAARAGGNHRHGLPGDRFRGPEDEPAAHDHLGPPAHLHPVGAEHVQPDRERGAEVPGHARQRGHRRCDQLDCGARADRERQARRAARRRIAFEATAAAKEAWLIARLTAQLPPEVTQASKTSASQARGCVRCSRIPAGRRARPGGGGLAKVREVAENPHLQDALVRLTASPPG
jgi:hypothetical protein